MQDRIGFIGLGVMGNPMAGHLVDADLPTTVYDIDPAVQQAFCSSKPAANAASNAAEVAAASDVIFTMLPDGHHVQEAVFGEDGLVAHMHTGSVLVDTSSSEPELTRQTADRLASHRISMIDAATSGAE